MWSYNSFYYVTNLDKDRNLKEPVNVNHIELQFLLGNDYKETNSNWFKMIIENDDNNNITPNLYLANEFYSIEEIVLNNENLSEYININVSSDGLSIGFYAVGEYSSNPVKPDSIPPFQLFLNLNMKLYEEIFGLKKVYILYNSSLISQRLNLHLAFQIFCINIKKMQIFPMSVRYGVR